MEIIHRVMLGVDEAFKQEFEPTVLGKHVRRSSSGKRLHGDGKGHEVSELQVMNQMNDCLTDTEKEKVGYSQKPIDGVLSCILKDDSMLSKIEYSRNHEGVAKMKLLK